MILLNADDFGASSRVNQAIMRAYHAGVLHSASLMMGETATEEALSLARANPSLRVGLHLVLVDGKSILPHSEIPDLVDEERNFPKDPARTWIRYLFSPSLRRQLEKEVMAQFEAFRKSGIPLSHVDGHHHQHIHPAVRELVIDLAKSHGAAWVRVPRENLGIWRKTAKRREIWKWLHGLIYFALTAGMEKKLRRDGFFVFDGVFGILETFSMTEEYVLKLFQYDSGGKYEIYFHPGADWNHDLELLLRLERINLQGFRIS